MLHFRVRLACVRHAASVDSEPGSNSHVKFAVHRNAARRNGGTTQLTRGRFIGSCVVQSVLIESGSSPVAFARIENSGRPVNAMPPADSHCLSRPSARLLVAELRCVRKRLTGCVYLHAYLVFKEPTAARQWRPTRHPLAPSAQVLPGRPRRRSVAARLGEPCEVTIAIYPCQHLNCSVGKKRRVRFGLKGRPS